MINIKDHKTGYLWDQWEHLGPKRRRLLQESWAGLFQEHVLPHLPVEHVFPFFSETMGRPTKELYAMLGVLVLQQLHDMTDNETIQQLAFNIQWHYALNITGFSDDETYLCPKTLWNVRQVVIEHNIDKVLFEQITDHFIKTFDVETRNQRLDSIHIKSNMKHLGRVRIIAATINKFLVNLKRHHPELYDRLSEDLKERYKNDKALSVFSLVKPSDSRKTLEQVSQDLFNLCQLFKDCSEMQTMSSYTLLLRVLNDQCTVTGKTVAAKPAKEIVSDSLQNPSDPDATYDGHKGKGYQVQVMETWSGDDTKPDLITYVEVEKAHESDANALSPAIKKTKKRDVMPKEILADSLYGSDDNINRAAQEGVTVIAPTMGKENEALIPLSEFEFSDKGKITACPEGNAPVYHKRKKERNTVAFEHEDCANCPHCKACQVKSGKKYYYLRFDDKAHRLAKRRAQEKTDKFKDRYRYRSGVEATMSDYDRLTGVKQLRVRGFEAVRFSALLKALSINIHRTSAFIKGQMKGAVPAFT